MRTHECLVLQLMQQDKIADRDRFMRRQMLAPVAVEVTYPETEMMNPELIIQAIETNREVIAVQISCLQQQQKKQLALQLSAGQTVEGNLTQLFDGILQDSFANAASTLSALYRAENQVRANYPLKATPAPENVVIDGEAMVVNASGESI